jgi:Lrp/AsnC family transcriptional regulator, leucine-responsive regulatory protein
MQSFDEFDRKLLSHLQKNNLLTAQELGNLVGLTTSAVQRRVQRLRKNKVIEADIAILAPSVSDYTVTFIVDVTLHLGNSKVIDDFKRLMSHCDEVAQCYYVTGAYDFVIIVNTRDMAHYERFSKQHLMDNPTIKQFYTHVVIDRVKVNYGVKV